MAARDDADDPADRVPLAFETEALVKVEPLVQEKADRSSSVSVLLAWSCQPWHWMLKLSKELNASFVFGVLVVYGFNQGFGGSFNGIVVDYYWKDVQGSAPWEVQVYRGITFLPWNVKPLYGFLTDAVAVAGYHRRPYFILPGLLSIASALGVALGGKLRTFIAVGLFSAGSLAAAIADVTIDAEAAKKTREQPALGPDIQSLCSACSSVGGLIGFACSGIIVHALGPQAAIGLLSIPSALFFILGFTFHEDVHRSSQVWDNLGVVLRDMWATLKRPEVWRPTLFMYLSWAICPRISEAKFYWYTDKSVGPGFSEEFIGMMYAIGSVGTLGAAIVYNKFLTQHSFRSVLKWTQILLAAVGTLDLLLVLRINLKLHLPDILFVIADESLTAALYRLKWMPLLVMCAKLCPSGIEGSFFAFLMSVDNLGTLSAQWNGGILLKACNVVRVQTPSGPGGTDFTFLWLAVLIRTLMLLLPLLFLFLVPNSGPNVDILTQGLTSAEPTSLENEPLNHQKVQGSKRSDLFR